MARYDQSRDDLPDEPIKANLSGASYTSGTAKSGARRRPGAVKPANAANSVATFIIAAIITGVFLISTFASSCGVFGGRQPDGGAAYTYAQYSRVKTGMSIAQVQKIFSSPGSHMMEFGGVPGGDVVALTWKNSEISMAMVTFVDGRVKSKTQSMLP